MPWSSGFRPNYEMTVKETALCKKQAKILTSASTLSCAIGGLVYYFGNQEAIETARRFIESGLVGYVLSVGGFWLTYFKDGVDNPAKKRKGLEGNILKDMK